jgi:hypothetical protein
LYMRDIIIKSTGRGRVITNKVAYDVSELASPI